MTMLSTRCWRLASEKSANSVWNRGKWGTGGAAGAHGELAAVRDLSVILLIGSSKELWEKGCRQTLVESELPKSLRLRAETSVR